MKRAREAHWPRLGKEVLETGEAQAHMAALWGPLPPPEPHPQGCPSSTRLCLGRWQGTALRHHAITVVQIKFHKHLQETEIDSDRKDQGGLSGKGKI